MPFSTPLNVYVLVTLLFASAVLSTESGLPPSQSSSTSAQPDDAIETTMVFINNNGEQYTETLSYFSFETNPSIIRIKAPSYQRVEDVPNFKNIKWETSIVTREAETTSSSEAGKTTDRSLAKRQRRITYRNAAVTPRAPLILIVLSSVALSIL